MARPRSDISKAILSLPRDMSVKQAVAHLKAKGVKTSENNIYRVRRLVKKRAVRRATPAARLRSVGASTTSSAEGLLRAVAAEIGLGHALDILEAERSKVRAMIG